MSTRAFQLPGKNVCDCPQPPGGRTVCDAGQLAICRIKNGQVEAECLTPPKALMDEATMYSNPRPFAQWALDSALGLDLEHFSALSKHQWMDTMGTSESFLRENLESFLLGNWSFTDERTGDRITMTMPAAIRTKGDPSSPLVEDTRVLLR
jgi:hypothetical protein